MPLTVNQDDADSISVIPARMQRNSKAAESKNPERKNYKRGNWMGYLNKVLLIGRLGQDPEKRVTPTGASVVNVNLATTEYYKDKSGNRQERTEWHKIVLWNRQAEIAEQYCRKGSQLYVEGSLQTRDWQDKDGNKRYTTEIVAKSLQMLDSKGQGQGQGSGGGYQDNRQQSNGQHDQTPASGPVGGDDFAEDDIPF